MSTKQLVEKFLESKGWERDSITIGGALFNGVAELIAEFHDNFIKIKHDPVTSKDKLAIGQDLIVFGNESGHEVLDGSMVKVYQVHGIYEDHEIEENEIVIWDSYNDEKWFALLSELFKPMP